MFSSDNPLDTCNFFYEKPCSSYLMTFPTSLLEDEELLFEHLLYHQTPPSAAAASASGGVAPADGGATSHVVTNSDNKNHKEEGEGEAVATSSETTKPQAAPPAKRKRSGVVKKQAGAPARRRTGKKDRHSKIYTAQGCRDRRMRLSLQIARKFFDLQDMLGFDKASKTIEWLFTKSKSAIRDLAASLPPHQRKPNFMLNSTTMSSTQSAKYNDDDDSKTHVEDMENIKLMKTTKSSDLNSIARESREKARARARQRTMEKKKQKELMLQINPTGNTNKNNGNNNSSSKLGSSSTPETVDQEESCGGIGSGDGGYPSNQELNSTLDAIVSSHQPQQSSLENQMSLGIIEKLIGSDSSASSSIYDDCCYLGLPRNWVVPDSKRMNLCYGSITGMDELQVILQHQNPNSVHMFPENQFSNSSSPRRSFF